MNPAIFLDRDGVINVDRHYCHKVSELELCEGIVEGLKTLHELGYLFVVVSNQSGVARGYHQVSDTLRFHQAINSTLKSLGAPNIDLFVFCPHLPLGNIKEYAVDCRCRKPATGMIDIAAHRLNIDLRASWLVGDRWSDIEAGHKRGLKSIQIKSKIHAKVHHAAVRLTDNFLDAANLIAGTLKSNS